MSERENQQVSTAVSEYTVKGAKFERKNALAELLDLHDAPKELLQKLCTVKLLHHQIQKDSRALGNYDYQWSHQVVASSLPLFLNPIARARIRHELLQQAERSVQESIERLTLENPEISGQAWSLRIAVNFLFNGCTDTDIKKGFSNDYLTGWADMWKPKIIRPVPQK